MRRSGALRRSIVFGLVLSASLLSGAGTTAHGTGAAAIMVDDDGAAKPGSCAGRDPAYRRIQAAVDAAGRDATIIVCPGTYAEQVHVRPGQHGLQLRSAEAWQARIRPPTRLNGPNVLVSISGADRVLVQHFALIAPARSSGCRSMSAMVRVTDATGAVVRANRIWAEGDATLGPCGFERGIRMRQSSGWILYNTIIDFRRTGIELQGSRDVRVLRNSVQWVHAADVCEFCADATSGIWVLETGATTISGNAVHSGRPPLDSPVGVGLEIGIRVSSSDQISMTDNLVYKVGTAFRLAFAFDSIVLRNRAFRIWSVGMWVDDVMRTRIEANTVRGLDEASRGITVQIDGGSGEDFPTRGGLNEIRRNTFLGFELDCEDTLEGSGTAGTRSTWTANVGETDSPEGICHPPA